jgi:hypothetical protein
MTERLLLPDPLIGRLITVCKGGYTRNLQAWQAAWSIFLYKDAHNPFTTTWYKYSWTSASLYLEYVELGRWCARFGCFCPYVQEKTMKEEMWCVV